MWFRRRRTPAQITLLQAADLLAKQGWVQGEFVKGIRHCAVGAIGAVAEKEAVDSQAAIDLLQAEVGWVTLWNDRRDQTAENVIETMRKVARRNA